MGVHDDADIASRNGKKKRGSVKNSSRLAAFAQGDPKGFADWSTCDPAWTLDAIHQITQLGGAIIFGMSRDGGSHSVTLLLDKNRTTLWFNGDADLTTEMEMVCTTLGDIAVTS